MKPSNIGGQAVMEGIMMRHKDKYAVAVRRPDKEIEIKVEDYKCTFGKAGFLKWVLMDLWPALQKDLDGFVMGLEFTGAALVTFIMVRCMQSGWVGWLIKK